MVEQWKGVCVRERAECKFDKRNHWACGAIFVLRLIRCVYWEINASI